MNKISTILIILIAIFLGILIFATDVLEREGWIDPEKMTLGMYIWEWDDPSVMVFTLEEAKETGDQLGADWNRFNVQQFRIGMDVELEHGLEEPNTNVSDDDPLITGKITLAHLNEFPDYYSRLHEMEEKAETFTLIFEDDNTFSIGTECYHKEGNYEVMEKQISFTDIVFTNKACEGLQEEGFFSKINEIQSFSFTSFGELLLNLKSDEEPFVFIEYDPNRIEKYGE